MNILLIRKFVLCMALCFFSIMLHAQITEVDLGINGLTCSQCSRSVEMRIRKLDFVKDVQMNLEHTQGKVFFKDNKKVEIYKIAQAVIDAGFSVRTLKAVMQMNNVAVANNTCWDFHGDKYQFIQAHNTTLNGPVTLQFLGDKYLQKKDLKKWQPLLKNNCTNNTGKTYYVSM